jgi:cell wall-associated NlpC family hydrolase
MTHAGDLEWINDYVGVPYRPNGRDRAGWDCWGLVVAVYRERLGLELPDYRWQAPYSPLDRLRGFSSACESLLGGLTLELEAPELWAMAMVYASHRPHHIGVVVGPGVLHAARYGGTIFDPLDRFARNNARVQWLRWRR